MNKIRYDEIDILKALGIVLMIMGHIRFGNQFNIVIHVFHVQLFYIVSGFLYKKNGNSFFDFLKKKTYQLLVPYISIALFHLIIKMVLFRCNFYEIIQLLYQVFVYNTDNFPIAGALWFLTSIFFVYVLYFLIDRIYNIYIKHFLVLLISLIGFVLSKKCMLPLALNTSLVCLLFFHVGHNIKLYLISEKYKRYSLFISIICLLIGIIIGLLNGEVNIRINAYNNLAYFYISSICLFIVLYNMSVKIKKLRFNKYLKYIGTNSLMFMSFNQLVLWIPNKLIDTVNNNALKIFMSSISLFFCLIIICLIIKLVDSNKISKYLCGRKNM